MALRRYRDSKAEIDGGVEQKNLTKGPMLEKVIDVMKAQLKGEV